MLWAALVFYFSSHDFSSERTSRVVGPLISWLFPDAGVDFHAAVHFTVRKMGHWSEYFVLAVLVFHGFRSDKKQWDGRWAIWTLGLIFLYALGDEFHQLWVPSRSGTLGDSLLDFFGGICGVSWSYLRRDRLEQ